jgi:hypothetical protein
MELHLFEDDEAVPLSNYCFTGLVTFAPIALIRGGCGFVLSGK